MRLQQYITEGYQHMDDITIYGLNELIQKDCKHYLSLIKGNQPLLRGMDSVIGTRIGKKSVRQDREPYGMNPDEAKNLNKWLVKNGHVDRSKAVISTSNPASVEMFGSSYYIFPIGKFNYTWIEATDVNISDMSTKWELEYIYLFSDNPRNKQSTIRKYPDITIDKLKEWFNTNKGFHIAYDKGYEIWMNCKSYYYVSDTDYVFNNKTGKFW